MSNFYDRMLNNSSFNFLIEKVIPEKELYKRFNFNSTTSKQNIFNRIKSEQSLDRQKIKDIALKKEQLQNEINNLDVSLKSKKLEIKEISKTLKGYDKGMQDWKDTMDFYSNGSDFNNVDSNEDNFNNSGAKVKAYEDSLGLNDFEDFNAPLKGRSFAGKMEPKKSGIMFNTIEEFTKFKNDLLFQLSYICEDALRANLNKMLGLPNEKNNKIKKILESTISAYFKKQNGVDIAVEDLKVTNSGTFPEDDYSRYDVNGRIYETPDINLYYYIDNIQEICGFNVPKELIRTQKYELIISFNGVFKTIDGDELYDKFYNDIGNDIIKNMNLTSKDSTYLEKELFKATNAVKRKYKYVYIETELNEDAFESYLKAQDAVAIFKLKINMGAYLYYNNLSTRSYLEDSEKNVLIYNKYFSNNKNDIKKRIKSIDEIDTSNLTKDLKARFKTYLENITFEYQLDDLNEKESYKFDDSITPDIIKKTKDDVKKYLTLENRKKYFSDRNRKRIRQDVQELNELSKKDFSLYQTEYIRFFAKINKEYKELNELKIDFINEINKVASKSGKTDDSYINKEKEIKNKLKDIERTRSNLYEIGMLSRDLRRVLGDLNNFVEEVKDKI